MFYSELSNTLFILKYDSIQEWPVKKKVTVRLIDQINEGREDVEKDFIMHLSSKLSKNDTSRALGLPKFCSLQRLNSQEHDYVKNDCLFIELRIDSANLVEQNSSLLFLC